MKQVIAIFFAALFCLTLVLPYQSVEAAEACWFGLLECDENGVVWESEYVSGNPQAAQIIQFNPDDCDREILDRPASCDSETEDESLFGDVSNTIPGYLARIGFFINYQVIPVLFGIALLVFLFNIFRYFIVGASNQETQKVAKRAALYGLAAFVFLVSLWGIVNVLVNGLGFDRSESLCPDYLAGWCGNINNDGTTTPGRPADNPTPPGDDPDDPDDPEPPTSNENLLGDLLYGSLSDDADYNFRSGAPRAANNVVQILPRATCASGFETLRLGAEVENNQAAYAIYKQNGATQWINLTDGTTVDGVTYDADTIFDLINTGATDITLIHTHQDEVPKQIGLNMFGYAPSAADMRLMCDNVINEATHITVDKQYAWTMSMPAGSCPRRSAADDNLPTISALLQLSLTNAARRNDLVAALVDARDTPSDLANDMAAYARTNDFNTLTGREIIAIASTLAAEDGLQIQRSSGANFCANF